MSQIKSYKSEVEHARLVRLYYWLSYHRFTAFIYGAVYFVSTEIIIVILSLLAAAFTPYMLYTLYRLRHYGWLTFFGIFVGAPLAIALSNTGVRILNLSLAFLPLLAFYFYCYLLRFSAREWVSDSEPEGEIRAELIDKENADGNREGGPYQL